MCRMLSWFIKKLCFTECFTGKRPVISVSLKTFKTWVSISRFFRDRTSRWHSENTMMNQAFTMQYSSHYQIQQVLPTPGNQQIILAVEPLNGLNRNCGIPVNKVFSCGERLVFFTSKVYKSQHTNTWIIILKENTSQELFNRIIYWRQNFRGKKCFL